MSEVNRIYADIGDEDMADQMNFQWVVLASDFDRVLAECEALQQRLNAADELNDSLRAQLAERDALPLDWEDQLFAEMQRRFELSKRDDNHMVNDDTQIGVEFARDWIASTLERSGHE